MLGRPSSNEEITAIDVDSLSGDVPTPYREKLLVAIRAWYWRYSLHKEQIRISDLTTTHPISKPSKFP